MNESRMLHVRVPENVRRAAAMRAGQAGENLSAYIGRLIAEDARDLLPLVPSQVEGRHDHV